MVSRLAFKVRSCVVFVQSIPQQFVVSVVGYLTPLLITPSFDFVPNCQHLIHNDIDVGRLRIMEIGGHSIHGFWITKMPTDENAKFAWETKGNNC